ncbi:glycosyltransferase family 1 protein [Sphingobacterium sp. DN00404]|uniref:Glycosyltransferase family 1 protein n=1 Tax=Sphingobacterium micropteri TaxID=2763501 RepID=A0ABR7YN79_9SPHI|nr:glycosyltransferase family 1 protein [Sphingobacterium micropteri]
MKVLFLVFHGFSEHNGISKKIWGQVKGFQECGTDVRLCYYEVLANGHRAWLIDGDILVDFGRGLKARIKKRIDYSELTAYAAREKFSLIYIRSYHNANPFTIRLIKKFRNSGAKVVMEIPTYPYDQEYIRKRDSIVLCIDRLFRRQLAKNLDAIVTFTQDKKVFGQETVRISNGIDFDALPLREPQLGKPNEIHLLGVAEVHYWHGYDRLIKGMDNYYGSNPAIKVYFHIVGHLSGPREETEIYRAIKQGNLADYVFLHGAMWGEDLDDIFNHCDFAIGSLGRHRSGITHIKTLKNREYAARGISFIYSEIDADFEGKPYILEASADDSPIDIQKIVTYCKSVQLSPQEIRQDITSLSWSCQMQKVIDSLNI